MTPCTKNHAKRALRSLLGWMLLAASTLASAQTLVSTRLADAIRSNGRGDINLMAGQGGTTISAAQLEQFRQAHTDTTLGTPRKYLSLGVDVNENNKGSETSSAQGVTLATVSLTVTRGGVTTTYSEFRTGTRALIASAGSTTRSRYYTVLGEGGSSRITGSNAVQSQFDSTLDIFVPDDLSTATSAVLQITLLDVNKTLGDPESFYDYSGGFEDLALLNQQDAYFLNVTVKESTSFTAEAPIVELVTETVSTDTAPVIPTPATWAYYPSAGSWYFIAYEDSYPQQGDYDFNDAVVAYRYKLGLNESGEVIRIEIESYLVADGALHTLNWQMAMALSGNASVSCTRHLSQGGAAQPCDAVVNGGQLLASPYPLIDNSGDYFQGSASWSNNTLCGSPHRRGAHAVVSVVMHFPQAMSAIGALLPELHVAQTGQRITTSLRDTRGFPYALILPSGWRPSCERTDLGESYPRLRSFIESGGTRDADWYLNRQDAYTFDITNWDWPI